MAAENNTVMTAELNRLYGELPDDEKAKILQHVRETHAKINPPEAGEPDEP